jgi:plasmid replication initiation protein
MVHGNKVNAIREYYVCKSNELIQKGRYNLTTQQQKIILFAISKIKKNDDPRQVYDISIDELCAACELEIDAGGTYYHRIKQDLHKLTNRLWVQFPDNSEGTISWLSDAYIIPLSGTVQVRFHEKLWPYLFDLREKYTQYHLSEVLVFKNKYAVRFFEIIRSHFTQQELDEGIEKSITMSVDQVRELLCVTGYASFGELERNVIRKALDEINQYSEQMNVTYEKIKTGAKVDKIRFIVTAPNMGEKMQRYGNSKKRMTNKKGKSAE